MTNLLPDNWSDIRQLVLKRDGFKCVVCGETGKLDIHHIHPKFFGGTHEPQNLISLCRKCHTDHHIDLQIKLGSTAMIKIASFLKKLIGLYNNQPLGDPKYLLLLKQLTGQTKFLPGQEDIINAVLKGKDVLYVIPTSGGKSLCFQLPAIVAEQQTLIISPQKTLMRDQVQSLQKKWIPATYINSDLAAAEIDGRVMYLQKNLFKLFYCAPERFHESNENYTEHALNLFKIPISLFVVDEAHCILKWGKSFRPDYSKLEKIKKMYGTPQTIALTATANKREQVQIIENLGMKNPAIFVLGFNRPNIAINVMNLGGRNKTQSSNYIFIKKLNALKNLLLQFSGKTIIFVPTIRTGEKLQEELKEIFHTELFHAGLNPIVKSNIQDRFSRKLSPEVNILISTSAFSMGVDIPNIRYIVHWTQPSSISDYFQEIGRAGRDGKPSLAILFKYYKDHSINEFLHEKSTEDIKPISERNKVRFKLKDDLNDMINYIYTKECRRKYILKYFGENLKQISKFSKIVDYIIGRRNYCCNNCSNTTRNFHKLTKQVNNS